MHQCESTGALLWTLTLPYLTLPYGEDVLPPSAVNSVYRSVASHHVNMNILQFCFRFKHLPVCLFQFEELLNLL